ncbi:MAG: hypothetical protein R3F34_10780 [Planctomycetota bacterium]
MNVERFQEFAKKAGAGASDVLRRVARRRRRGVETFDGTPLERSFAASKALAEDLWPKLVGRDGRSVRHVLVASPERGSGASFVAAATAWRLAEHLRSAIALVELDLESPRLAKILGIPAASGTSEVLLGQAELATSFAPVPTCPNLRVLLGGAARRLAPGEFATPAMERARAELEQKCRTTIWIAPPLATCADMRLFASRVDGVVLVTKSGGTKKDDLTRTLAMLDESGASLIGAVLTGYDQPPPFVGRAA